MSRGHRFVFLSLGALIASASLLLPTTAGADTLTVSQWGIGYSTINAAIDDAVDGDIVSVEMGIYSEDVDFDGKNITVISTSGPSVTTILGSYTAVNFDNGESSDASLDGFTVTAGSFGLYIQSSSPVIRDCVIADNTSYAAYIYHYSNPTFEDCTFEDNSGSYPVYMYLYTEPTFTGCTFQNNSATHGGGMYIDAYNDVTVDGCTFLNNTASSYGGALYLYYSGLELTNSHFEGNSGYYGTVSINSGTWAPVSVRDNVIFDNDAEYGGAFYIYDTPVYISDNQIVENAASTAGGAFYLDYYTRATILNNTVVGSTCYGTGSGFHVASYNDDLIANNIIAHSTNGEGIYASDSTSRVQMVHNDIYDHADGNYGGYYADQTGRHGNVSVDPAFTAYSFNGDLADDDLSLQVGSPLLDAGAPAFLDADGTVSDLGFGGGDDEMTAPAGYDIVVSQLDNGDYRTINDALAAANHGDSILVYPGVYYQDVDIQGVDASVVSLGAAEVTVIAGSTYGVYMDGGEATTLEGFTIWAGSYGTYIVSSSPTFEACWFRFNYSYSAYNYHYSNPTYRNCLFEENSGSYPFYSYYYVDLTVDGCTFRDNTATHGGGMYIDSYCDVDVTNSVFDGNVASSHAGAIYGYYSELNVEGCTFSDNSGYYGTISLNSMSSPALIDGNTFAGNYGYYGGALYSYDTQAHVSHNLLNGNEASYGGGLYLDYYSHLLVANNTLVGNEATTYGGGVYASYYLGAALVNNIIANSSDGAGIYSDYDAESVRLYIANNDVYGNYDGEYGGALTDHTGLHGNLNVDPQFTSFVDDHDPNNDDLSLAGNSPCIDTGAIEVPDADASRSDMGYTGGDLVGDVAGADWVVSQRGDGDTRSIVEALSWASSGDVIAVQPGVYDETVDYGGLEVTIRGTLGKDVTYIGGSSGGVNWDNGETSDARLESMSVWTGDTFGMYIVSSDPTISDCRVLYCSSYSAYVYHYANPTFEDTHFYRNTGSYPQYVYYYAEPTFRRCRFEENVATHGGGLYVDSYSDVLVESSSFEGNYASSYGGALYAYYSDLTVSDSTFTDNYGYYGTVHLQSMYGDDYFYRNTFCHNSAEYGGAWYMSDVTSAYLGNNIVQDNEAGSYGGAVYMYGSDPSLINNTFVENTGPAGQGGHLYVDAYSTLGLTNNIMAWAEEGDGVYVSPTGVSYNIFYNDFWENTADDFSGLINTVPATNYAVDPLFVDYTADGICGNDDLALGEGSPLIDAGAPTLYDDDGSRSDVGAYGGGGPPNPDYDHDGYGVLDGDCDNMNDDVYPGAPEIADGLDNDCDGDIDEGTIFADDDGDGYTEDDGDCDDADPNVHPGAAEVCDYVDNDCDGDVDEGALVTFYGDGDGDGFGVAGDTVEDCAAPPGYAALSGDCDDADASINPGAAEICDGVDQDCDGVPDDGLTFLDYWPDNDGDGYGDIGGAAVNACVAPAAHVQNNGDCNDGDAAIHPGAAEGACDYIDNDCDGALHGDEVDDDGDGVDECSGDCDDAQATVFPGGVEICDGLDNDCDGTPDDGLTFGDWFPDADGDGYGDASAPATQACNAPPGFVADHTDCDDSTGAVNPGAAEVACDGMDNDCDGTLHADDIDDDADGDSECAGDCDDNNAALNLADLDGDGFSTCAGDCDDNNPDLSQADEDGDGVSTCDGDCDDDDDETYPGAPELCDGEDNNCDGLIQPDEVDDDGDGFIDCDGDCDDADASIHPGAPEQCDGTDNDCDGVVDEETNLDLDGDGFTPCDGDCDDYEDLTFPGAAEICDGADNDCDGTIPPDETDADADGWMICDGDCDDTEDAMNPGEEEICDGLDNDCDVTTQENVDDDGDGQSECDGDCDDADPLSFDGAPEMCDGIDNDCDGAIPSDEADADGDGWMVCFGDCDDADPLTYPGAPEQCDGIDNDCDGLVDEYVNADNDGDGFTACGGDCNDNDPTVFPGATELCDGLDNNCDGVVPVTEVDADSDGWMVCDGDCDDTDPALNFDDVDADGYATCDGDCDDTDPALNLDDTDTDGYATCDGDCDDADASTYPGAAEACDGLDNDCNGLLSADETDDDADTWTECDGDCDDSDPNVNPDAEEDCFDGIDNDCDGLVDGLDDECAGDDDDDDTVGDDDDTATDDDDTIGDDDDTVGDDDDDSEADDDDTDIPFDDDDTDLTSEEGCECHAGATPSTATWFALIPLLVGLLSRRRR